MKIPRPRILRLTDIDGNAVICNFDEIDTVRVLTGFQHGANCNIEFKSGRVVSVREEPGEIIRLIEAFS